MSIAQAACTIIVTGPAAWSADWAWGVPLIVTTVLIHVAFLSLIGQRAIRLTRDSVEQHHPTVVFLAVVGATTLAATCLHAFESGLWAIAYVALDALPDFRSSMLYSLNAITSYGHTELALPERWQLMGAMEALNGWLLFGLTTAFLFAVIEKAWLVDRHGGHH